MHQSELSGQEKIEIDPAESYLFLLQRIDLDINRLLLLYARDITCRPGCSICCINLTVFPVEFFAILASIEQTGIASADFHFNETASCGFLNNGMCRIYPFRPIICRTHGLPILFLNDASIEPSWEVSFCELNFSGMEHIEFDKDTLLDIEEINAALNRINHDFVKSHPELHYLDQDRIPLKELYFRIKR